MVRNQDECEWSLNTSLMLTFWSSISRARWPFLEANVPVVVSFDHWNVNQELVEEWKRRHVCSLSKIVECQEAQENHRRPPNCSVWIRVTTMVRGPAA